MPSIRTLAAASVAALALTGCTAMPGDSATGPRVVVTTTQLGDWTRNLVGDLPIQVHQLLQPGQDVHEYDPSAADLLAISQADLVIINGSGLDDWLDSAFTAAGYTGTVLDTTGTWLPEFAEPYLTEQDAEHGLADHHDHDDDHDDDHAGHDHSDDHAGHDHGPIDPHTWTAVPLAQRQVAEISAGLQKIVAEPEAMRTIQANEEAYQAKLTELDTWTRETIAQVRQSNRTVATTHPSLTWFAHEYGVEETGLGYGFTWEPREGTIAEQQELWDKVAALKEEHGIEYLIGGSQTEERFARLLAEELDIELLVMEDGLRVDSLAPAGTFGDTYITSHIHNVAVVMTALGYAITSPESLAG